MTTSEEETFEFVNKDYDGGNTKGHPPSSGEGGGFEALTENAAKILPVIMGIIDGIEKGVTFVSPYVKMGFDLYDQFYKSLEPYGAEEIMTCITGFVLMFFGGSFATLTATYEAIQQAGMKEFQETVKALFTEYTKFREENEADDEEDLDGDGIADTQQISGSQYVARKTLLFLKSTNPDAISRALQQLYTIFIAVMAVLSLRFAQTISLGSAIGDQLQQLFEKFGQPQLERVVDPEYHKWLGPAGTYLSRFVGVMVAFRIQIILITVHTSMKGGRMLSQGLTALAEKHGYGYLTEGYLDEALGAVLAVMGMIVQIFMWSSVPIIIQLILFPVFFLEGLLNFIVGIGLTMGVPQAA